MQIIFRSDSSKVGTIHTRVSTYNFLPLAIILLISKKNVVRQILDFTDSSVLPFIKSNIENLSEILIIF